MFEARMKAMLAALTMQISNFVREGTLDSRLAAMPVKRLKERKGQSNVSSRV
jgi:hypothetical protein